MCTLKLQTYRNTYIGQVYSITICLQQNCLECIRYSSYVQCRKRSSSKKDEFAVSANMAYGEIKLGTKGEVGGEYEDPDKIVRSGRRENQQAALYESITNKPSASET